MVVQTDENGRNWQGVIRFTLCHLRMSRCCTPYQPAPSTVPTGRIRLVHLWALRQCGGCEMWYQYSLIIKTFHYLSNTSSNEMDWVEERCDLMPALLPTNNKHIGMLYKYNRHNNSKFTTLKFKERKFCRSSTQRLSCRDPQRVSGREELEFSSCRREPEAGIQSCVCQEKPNCAPSRMSNARTPWSLPYGLENLPSQDQNTGLKQQDFGQNLSINIGNENHSLSCMFTCGLSSYFLWSVRTTTQTST